MKVNFFDFQTLPKHLAEIINWVIERRRKTHRSSTLCCNFYTKKTSFLNNLKKFLSSAFDWEISSSLRSLLVSFLSTILCHDKIAKFWSFLTSFGDFKSQIWNVLGKLSQGLCGKFLWVFLSRMRLDSPFLFLRIFGIL